MSKRDARLAAEKSDELRKMWDHHVREYENVTNMRSRRRKAEASSLCLAFHAVIIFAQEEGGSGCCIHEDGIILTCAHVLGSRPKLGMKRHGIFVNGLVFLAEAIALDVPADIAFMKITKAEESHGLHLLTFPSISIADEAQNKTQQCFCVGQPYPFDLEGDPERDMKWDLVTTSKGSIIKVLAGDVLDNSDIGKLVHDAWTYWGHSGAPLLDSEGRVLGIHSSWDDETGSRHGVALEALHHFHVKYQGLWT